MYFQIAKEEFLEDINNMLNLDEVPNVFEKDDMDNIISTMRDLAAAVGIPHDNQDAIFDYFIHCVR